MVADPNGLVVVGASLAGLRAVEAARKIGYDGPITLIGAEPELPYDRPPLSKEMLDADHDPHEGTTFRTEGYLRDDLGVRLMLGSAATGLDPHARVARTAAGLVGYERLIVATGVAPRPMPGHQAHPRVRTLRTVEDARAIREAIDRGDRILVVGCGFIGSEVASAVVKRGREVTLVELAPVPLARAVGEHAGNYFAHLHRRHGVDLRLGCTVETLSETDRGLRAALSDGTQVEADLVVVGLGASPATDWLKGTGIALETDGSVAADSHLRASMPGVYAAGDVVTWDNGLFGRRMRLEHWTSAAEQAAVAARNAVGKDGRETYGTVPYFWSDLHGKRVQAVGIHSRDSVEFVGDGCYVVLHHTSGVLVGALVVAQPRLTMKLRRMIADKSDGADACELVTQSGLEDVRPRIR